MRVKLKQKYNILLFLLLCDMSSIGMTFDRTTSTETIRDTCGLLYSHTNIHLARVSQSDELVNNFKIGYDGEIILSDDDKAIIDIIPGPNGGGFFEVEKLSFGKLRKVVIESEEGRLMKYYYLGWELKNFEPGGQQWLADILPRIVRNSTIGAKSRVKRFFKKGGTFAVLEEIKNLKKDYVKTRYFEYLLAYNFNHLDLEKVIQFASETIDSDYHLSKILQANQRRFLREESTTTAYIDALEGIESDFYLSNSIRSVVKNKKITDVQLIKLLWLSNNIKSDYFLSLVLEDIVESNSFKESNVHQVISLSKKIKEKERKTKIVQKALSRKKVLLKEHKENMEAIEKNKKQHNEMYVRIDKMLIHDLDDKALSELLTLIGSQKMSELKTFLVYKKLSGKTLSNEQLVRILLSVRNSFNSDDYLSYVLIAFAPKVKKSPQKVKNAYVMAAKSIKSDIYFGKIMRTMI